MTKPTPSRIKFRQAKKIVEMLRSWLGDELKSVFVGGSVAANMARSNSDIDFVFVCLDYERARKIMRRVLEEKLLPNRIDFKIIGASDFEAFTSLRAMRKEQQFSWFAEHCLPDELKFEDALRSHERLTHGAIPVYGKEYAYHNRRSWVLPNMSSIRKRYVGEKPKLRERVSSKRSKSGRQRFL